MPGCTSVGAGVHSRAAVPASARLLQFPNCRQLTKEPAELLAVVSEIAMFRQLQ